MEDFHPSFSLPLMGRAREEDPLHLKICILQFKVRHHRLVRDRRISLRRWPLHLEERRVSSRHQRLPFRSVGPNY
jgi:hypothetical protein